MKRMIIAATDTNRPEYVSPDDVKAYLERRVTDRSAFGKGVKEYVEELVLELAESIEYQNLPGIPTDMNTLKELLLNGASSWEQYSWDGCSLIYNEDIVERLCTPSEQKKYNGGSNFPGKSEELLDTQARALTRAWKYIWSAVDNTARWQENHA